MAVSLHLAGTFHVRLLLGAILVNSLWVIITQHKKGKQFQYITIIASQVHPLTSILYVLDCSNMGDESTNEWGSRNRQFVFSQ